MEFRMSVLLFLLFFVGIHESKACLEVERLALLEFKELFNSEGYDADYLLPSWEDDPTSECCEWERVSCNGTTGHVTKLSLDNIRQVSRDYDYNCFDKITIFFNISIFQYFDDLLLLNLSCNSLVYSNHKKGSENILRLKRLETLDLSFNNLDGSIVPSIKGLASLKNLNLGQNTNLDSPLEDLLSFEHLEMLNCQDCQLDIYAPGEEGFASIKRSKLKHLDISGNYLQCNFFPSFGKLSSLEYLDLSGTFSYRGTFDIHEIAGLSNLSVLLMSDSFMNGTLSIQNQTALPKLQVLDLSGNQLNSISSEFGALISLKFLDLSYNEGLNDSSIQVLCGMKMLEELHLRYAGLTVIPRCLHNLTSLKVLDLSDNAIHGQLPSSWIAALTSLKYINIRNNYFHGVFSFSAFNNHSHLESVFLGSRDQSFKVETEDEDWMPKFQLKTLVLPKCNLNLFGHKTPSFLPQQHELRLIDLSDNNIQGRFPDWLLANNSRMVIFNLSNNSFTGDFNMSLYPMIDLISVDVSENQIQGILPRNIGNIFPNLGNLQLSSNAFGGSLPSSVGLMRNLEVLDLSSNNFRGAVPETLFQCSILRVLKLSNNEFTGNFFSTRYNLSNLMVLQLNDNKFTGSVSNVNSIDLLIFDVSFNFMSGRLPNWTNRTHSSILKLRHNSLKGEVSCDVFEPCPDIVDLSHNSLSGTLPSCSSMEGLGVVHLQSNNFTGSTPEAFFNSSTLSLLNLRDNRLSNSIPDKIGNSLGLRALLLGGNQLSGLIPKNLCLLESIRIMDLSHNYLSGSIPLCLANISFGTTYDQGKCIYYPCAYLDPYPLFDVRILFKFWVYFDELGENHDEVLHAVVFDQTEFMTKKSLNMYDGGILNLMSGLDLSCNNLVGKIPSGLGNFTGLHAMNLSHNRLTGPIPNTFASLAQVESLDLSHNRLSGEIPSQLTQLTSLEVFSVAYNNLSGRIPYGKGQFGTFERSSYEGNAYLCGKPLDKNCSGDDESAPPSMPLLPANGDEHWYDIDKVTFFASFSASFFVFFSGAIAFLYVNPYWRQRLFYYGEKFVLSCYYFVSDAVFMLSLHFRRA